MYKSNADDRAELIEGLGQENFDSNPSFDYMRNIPIPDEFVWIFQVYMEIYGMATEGITWNDVESYCRMRKVDLTQYEINTLLKIKRIANATIKKLKEDE